jgi:peptide deformylase
MASSTDTVAAFEALLSRAKTHAQGEDLIGTLLSEINTALADILACMEKPEVKAAGGEADAIAKAVAGALAGLQFPAPVVNIAPAAVTVQSPAEREQMPPNIVINPVIASPAGTQFRVEIERSSFSGKTSAFTVTKL